MDAFDLVVIGSGPAAEKGAAQAAYFGERVALVERKANLRVHVLGEMASEYAAYDGLQARGRA